MEEKSGHLGCNTGAPSVYCVYPKGHKYAGYVISPLSPPTGIGVGANATVDINTPVVQLHASVGAEYVYDFSEKESTLFIIPSLGGSLGPNLSFAKAPINKSVSPYLVIVHNTDRVKDDYSGPFRTHTLTMAIGNKGGTLGTSYSPEEEGIPRTSKRHPIADVIGPAIGYALTSDYSSSYYIPIFTRDERTDRFTYHISTIMDHLKSALSFFVGGG